MENHRAISEEMEDTILSSSYKSATSSPESNSPRNYKEFCHEMETDKTVNSTMIENFKENINISQHDVGKCLIHPNCITQHLPDERSILALGPRKSYQQIKNTYYHPIKSFWWTQPLDESKKPEVGFHQKDDIFKELQCNSCSYTTFQKKGMILHVDKWHTSKILNIPAIVRKEPVIEDSKLKENKTCLSDMPASGSTGIRKCDSKAIEDKTSNSNVTVPTEGRDYHIKDMITKELKCNFCGFELFGKKKMHQHLERFHIKVQSQLDVFGRSNVAPKDSKEKISMDIDKKSASPDKPQKQEINSSDIKPETYYHMKDPVSKELRCNFCRFETFSKKKMIQHLSKVHRIDNGQRSGILKNACIDYNQNEIKAKSLHTVNEETFEPVDSRDKDKNSVLNSYVSQQSNLVNYAMSHLDERNANYSRDSALSISYDRYIEENEHKKAPIRKNKRVKFEGEQLSSEPKRRLASPDFVSHML